MRYALPCSKIRPWPIPQHLQIRCGISTKIRRTPVGEASASRHQGRSTSASLKPHIHHGNMVPGGSRTHCAEMASQTTNSKNLSPTSLQNSVQNTFQYILVFLTETYLFYITKSNKMIFQKKIVHTTQCFYTFVQHQRPISWRSSQEKQLQGNPVI